MTMLGCLTQCGTTRRENSRPDSFTSFGEPLLVHYPNNFVSANLNNFSDQISAVGNLHIAVIATLLISID
ncbi:MAG: hypothetical protein EBV58_01270 [Actinobacteria bacterium]|nr:hypothetical protein [Actinomycetota bacterium]